MSHTLIPASVLTIKATKDTEGRSATQARLAALLSSPRNIGKDNQA
jgi:hypothetical protein